MSIYTHVNIHVNTHVNIHVYLHEYLQVYTHVNIHVYLHGYLQVYTHVNIGHVCVCICATVDILLSHLRLVLFLGTRISGKPTFCAERRPAFCYTRRHERS